MAFDDFDVEIQDEKDSQPEVSAGNTGTIGNVTTIAHSTGRQIKGTYIESPRIPPTVNPRTSFLEYSIDGGTTYFALKRGEWISLPGVFDDLRLKSNATGTFYKVIIWG